MKALLLVFIAALSCGFLVLTPEEGRELNEARRQWHRDVEDRYNRKALQAFLLSSIRETKEIEGIDVQEILAGRKFSHRDDFCLGSGRWVFVSKDPKSDSFELRATAGSRGWAVFACKREGIKAFKVERTYVDSFIQLCPPPYSISP